jgi:Icc-related predicted phosphoesterase
MKIAAISDTHGYLPEPPECDVLIHAGDWTPAINHSRSFQKEWMLGPFKEWLHNTIFIAGNHDFVARSDEDLLISALDHGDNWYLKNEAITLNGVKFWGSPYSCKFGDWAFMRDEEGLDQIWQTIPDDTNVIIVHGPPYGYGDKCMYYDSDPHQGSKTLTARMEELTELKLVITGHIHEAAGVYDFNGIPVANCSYVDLTYKPRHGYLEFDL